MFDKLISDIIEAHRRVIDETSANIDLRMNRYRIELVVFDGDSLKNMHTAYLYGDMPEEVEIALERIHSVLVSTLKDGAVEI